MSQHTLSEFLVQQNPQENLQSDSNTDAFLLPVVGGADPGAEGRTPVSRPLEVVLKGFDTLEITFKMLFKDLSLFDRLKDGKRNIQSSNSLESVFDFGQSGSFIWNLQRIGTQLYTYVLKTGDITLFLSNRKSTSNIPNCSLHIGSISCNNGYLDILKQFKAWLKLLQIEIKEEKVSRVDFFCDVPTDIRNHDLYDPDKFVSQVRNHAVYYFNRKVCGIMFGKGSVALRIYDKVLEMKEKRNLEKILFFQQLWGFDVLSGSVPVTRFEFQLRREILKELRITDLKSLQNARKTIWRYLTKIWYRHETYKVDRKNKNQSRNIVSPIWRIVSLSFGFTSKVIRRLRSQTTVSVESLRLQVRGCLLSIIAATGMLEREKHQILETAASIVIQDLENMMTSTVDIFDNVFRQRRVNSRVSF